MCRLELGRLDLIGLPNTESHALRSMLSLVQLLILISKVIIHNLPKFPSDINDFIYYVIGRCKARTISELKLGYYNYHLIFINLVHKIE